MGMTDVGKYWAFPILLGLVQSTRYARRFRLHRLHPTAVLDGRRSCWPEAEWGFDTCIFALYVLLLTAPMFYLRRRIGVGRWKILHRFVLTFYVLTLWHALLLGLDISHYQWVRPVIWLAQIPLLVLLVSRLREAAAVSGRTQRRYPASPTTLSTLVIAASPAANPATPPDDRTAEGR